MSTSSCSRHDHPVRKRPHYPTLQMGKSRRREVKELATDGPRYGVRLPAPSTQASPDAADKGLHPRPQLSSAAHHRCLSAFTLTCAGGISRSPRRPLVVQIQGHVRPPAGHRPSFSPSFQEKTHLRRKTSLMRCCHPEPYRGSHRSQALSPSWPPSSLKSTEKHILQLHRYEDECNPG